MAYGLNGKGVSIASGLFMRSRSPNIALRGGVRQMKRTVVPTRIARAWFEQPHFLA